MFVICCEKISKLAKSEWNSDLKHEYLRKYYAVNLVIMILETHTDLGSHIAAIQALMHLTRIESTCEVARLLDAEKAIRKVMAENEGDNFIEEDGNACLTNIEGKISMKFNKNATSIDARD